MNHWKCSICNARATAYLAPTCHDQKMLSTVLALKRKLSEISGEKAESSKPRERRKFVSIPKRLKKPQQNSLSVLFIPFDAGGTYRTKTGLLGKGSRGEMLLSENDSFFRLPFSEDFLEKREFTMMPKMQEKDLVTIETEPDKGLLFRTDMTDKMMVVTTEKRQTWDVDYASIAENAVSKISRDHDRKWEKNLFFYAKVGKRSRYVKCDCIKKCLAPRAKVPRAYPDVIFLSEELKYNHFPDYLDVFGVRYIKQVKSALKYDEKGNVKQWKQQISCYVRSEHRDSHEKDAVFASKRRVTNNKENVLILSKKMGGVQLAVCGVHFSSKYVGQCKKKPEKSRDVLQEKIEWSKQDDIDMFIGDFNFDCSFDYRFMPEYVSGPQYVSVGKHIKSQRLERVISTRSSNTSQVDPLRFMNAVVTNDLTTIYPNHVSGIARPVIGDQSTEDGFYSDHPWIFVTVGKETSRGLDTKLSEDVLMIDFPKL